MNTVNTLKTREVAFTGLLVALLSIAGYISFPIPFTPIVITAQTIVINLIALILRPRNAVLAIISFLIIGAIGVPVFSGGSAGVGAIVGPTGGYLIGFVAVAFVISYLSGNTIDLKKYLILTIFIGMPIIYFFGATWMCIYTGSSLIETIKIAIIPFIIGDLIKAIISSVVAVKIKKLI